MKNKYPKTWMQVRLSEINNYKSAGLNPANFGTETFELYSVPSFSVDAPEIVKGKEVGSSKQVVKSKDVLICKINPRINRVWQVKTSSTLRKIASSEWIVVRVPEFNSNYLQLYFSSPRFRELIVQDVTGVGGSLTRAQPKRVANFPVPIAPFNEQQRIAKKLNNLLARVDSCQTHLERIPQILKRFRQSVLAAATSGRMTEDWREEKGVNGEWENCVLGNVLADIKYGTAKKSIYELKKGIPVLRIPNVKDGKIDATDLKFSHFDKKEIESLSLKTGDLLLIRSNGSVDLVGKVAIVDSKFEGFMYAGYLIRLRFDTSKVNPQYISFYLSSPAIRSYIELTARSTSGVNNINSEEVKAISLDLPSIQEQAEIVRRVEKLFAYAARLEDRYTSASEHVERLTPSLLAKAFRGELVEQDQNDEPAEKLLQRIIEIRQIEEERKKTEPRKKKEKKMSQKTERKSLYETLLETGVRLTPEDLFEQAGFDEKSIDEFYEELRAEIKKKRIEEIRQGSEKVYLKGVSK